MLSRGHFLRPAVLASLACSLLTGSAILAASGQSSRRLGSLQLASLRGTNQNYTIAWSDCNTASGGPPLRDCSQPGTCSGCTSNIFQIGIIGGYNFYYIPTGNGNQCGTQAINGTCDCVLNPDGSVKACYGCTGGSGNGPCGGSNAPQSQ